MREVDYSALPRQKFGEQSYAHMVPNPTGRLNITSEPPEKPYAISLSVIVATILKYGKLSHPLSVIQDQLI